MNKRTEASSVAELQRWLDLARAEADEMRDALRLTERTLVGAKAWIRALEGFDHSRARDAIEQTLGSVRGVLVSRVPPAAPLLMPEERAE